MNIVLITLAVFTVISLYCYYLGFTGKNKFIQNTLANCGTVFFFADFLIMTVVAIGLVCVFL